MQDYNPYGPPSADIVENMGNITNHISKGFYLSSIYIALLVSLCSAFTAGFLSAAGQSNNGIENLLMTLFFIGLIVYVVMFMVLIYKLWAAIQIAPARTTPGKAVGFLFIPFFNLYWIFQAYWGWAQDYNAYLARHGLTFAPGVSDGLALTYSILRVLMAVPIVNYLVLIPLFIIEPIFLNKAITGANFIISRGQAADSDR